MPHSPPPLSFALAVICGVLTPNPGRAEDADAEGSRKSEPMVEIRKAAPRIVVGLRYTSWHNLTKRAIYPKEARALLRKGVAERLVKAQSWLDNYAVKGTRIKIWDAYRPEWAQRLLWHVLPNKEYVGDPSRGSALHTWGVCVDATLVDRFDNELQMPTDFDVISPKAKTSYAGSDPTITRNLRWLQQAMTHGGFLVVYDEWWHFVARDWKAYGEIDCSLTDPPTAPPDQAPAKRQPRD